jgi:hypothetical protein
MHEQVLAVGPPARPSRARSPPRSCRSTPRRSARGAGPNPSRSSRRHHLPFDSQELNQHAHPSRTAQHIAYRQPRSVPAVRMAGRVGCNHARLPMPFDAEGRPPSPPPHANRDIPSFAWIHRPRTAADPATGARALPSGDDRQTAPLPLVQAQSAAAALLEVRIDTSAALTLKPPGKAILDLAVTRELTGPKNPCLTGYLSVQHRRKCGLCRKFVMARPGLEPGTPRFSVVCPPN